MDRTQPKKGGWADLGPTRIWADLGPTWNSSSVWAGPGPDMQSWASIGLAQQKNPSGGENYFSPPRPPPACRTILHARGKHLQLKRKGEEDCTWRGGGCRGRLLWGGAAAVVVLAGGRRWWSSFAAVSRGSEEMGNSSARSLVGEDEAALWQGAAAAVVEDQRKGRGLPRFGFEREGAVPCCRLLRQEIPAGGRLRCEWSLILQEKWRWLGAAGSVGCGRRKWDGEGNSVGSERREERWLAERARRRRKICRNWVKTLVFWLTLDSNPSHPRSSTEILFIGGVRGLYCQRCGKITALDSVGKHLNRWLKVCTSSCQIWQLQAVNCPRWPLRANERTRL